METYLDLATFHNRLILEGTLSLQTALRIGTGGAETATGPEITVVRDALGRPYIPGSSFKGVLRTTIERFARTVNHPPHLWACPDPLAINKATDGACVPAKGDEEDEGKPGKDTLLARARENGIVDEQQYAAALWEHTCTVCRLFGSPWLASKIRVKDLFLDESTWLGRVELRNGVAIDRDTRTSAKNLLYHFEVVPSGAEFACEILVENATDLEIGLLMYGLREMQQGRVAFGGGRSRGLGWAALSEMSGSWIEGADALLDYVTTGTTASLSQLDLESYLAHLKLTAEGGNDV